MATIAANSYPMEWNFIDNPVVVGLTDFNFPADTEEVAVTFKQLVAEVTVMPSFSAAEAATYTFQVDVSGIDTVWIDISSALRAAMGAWQPSPDEIRTAYDLDRYLDYPFATFTLKAWERYLMEGVLWEEAAVEREAARAYYGGLSEYERLSIQTVPADYFESIPFSKKPATGEVYGVGDWYARTYLTGSEGNRQVHSDWMQHTDGVLAAGSYLHFMFINSLGVLETCSAAMRQSLSYGIESERKNLVTTPAFFATSGRTAAKTGGRAVMQMSSGTVGREWADWWTTEFLLSRRHWVQMGTTRKMSTDGTWADTPLWLPCTVTPADDATLIYNLAEQRLPHVDFEVEVALSGSLLNPLRL